MFPAVPDRVLTELGRTEGGPDTLGLLVRDQDTRRLLVLRAVLDAAESADHAVCTPAQKTRLREDWALLVEADRGAAGRGTDGPGSAYGGGAESLTGSGTRSARAGDGSPPSPVGPARALLFQPLTGPWARSCLRGLDAVGTGPPGESRARQLRRDLAHFSAIATVAAARAGLTFTTRLTARSGVLTLPSLGALHTAASGDVAVEVRTAAERMTLRQADAPDVTVHLESGTGAWSGALAWTPAHALPGLLPSAPAMPLDDLDPYREVTDGPRYGSLSDPVTLDDAERKRWLQAWSGTAAALRSGGAQRLAEAVALLRCLVPLEMPPEAGGRGSCSATRREAFGALLSSTPADPVTFAATLVHELHHTKLAALSDMVTLHQADAEARYFAPWRPDPRPYGGLLQGVYSHLAIAAFFQRRALLLTKPPHREYAWAQHARYRAQVGAALPALVGSPDLTVPGRRFVDEMVATYQRMAENPAPRGHTVRAQAYVKAARTLWTRRHAALPRPNE
ncbi:HEXXH motif-containing putative peptide modification protein [Streptomyces sp. DH24]|uniref:aKG-HExxH-type peptide beta-hydroxylase n=1 Tax=Streptomyces sp. DH24 TaxID=3040123 RepID=UPI002441B12E|nr:HEXXH motif-containing putative peptide modification protein [Streptomyces sp. DH24]MDG9716558.1 HEXXH motif-containing putative peptide modification protein [Streptomyces sp. DH24]